MKQMRHQNGITIIADVENGQLNMAKMMRVMFELPDGSAIAMDCTPEPMEGAIVGGWPSQFFLALV